VRAILPKWTLEIIVHLEWRWTLPSKQSFPVIKRDPLLVAVFSDGTDDAIGHRTFKAKRATYGNVVSNMEITTFSQRQKRKILSIDQDFR